MPRRSIAALLVAAAVPLALLFSHATSAVARAAAPSSADAFLPSRYGLAFVNPSPAPDAPLLARATTGRCGGMAFAALDHYARGERPAMSAASDAYITMRNLTSVIDNAPRFVAWSIEPQSDAWWRGGTVPEITREVELPRLTEALEAGPVPLGLTRARSVGELSRNHQAVAYAIEQTEEMALVRVYDPNLPGADDVVLQVDLADPSEPILQIRGELVVADWSGLFVERYAPPLLR